MKSSVKRVFRLGFIILVIGMISNCAGSKSGSQTASSPKGDEGYGEIEELLGLTPEGEKKEQPAATTEDDNLLDLLQSGQSQPGTAAAGVPANHARIQELEREISNLQRKLDEKDQTISMLRQQIVAMENQRPASPPPPSGRSSRAGDSDLKQQYDAAMRAFNSRRYREAIPMFEAILDQDMNHSLSDNAQYWIGECYYALGDYRAAILAFEKVFTFKNSNKNDYAQFKLGMCYYKLNERERARQEFQTLVDNYPKSSLISRARQYLAGL